jgi:hypothetical protein
MMRERYVTVVGVLGDPASGKTACLASLYLLISNDRLAGWSFADSRSLMAFEDIARGAREWNAGQPPEQMTVHTEMADDRQPGFLHLRLRRKTDSRCFDFVVPDLPGEWTQALVRSANSERLEFLRSADVIWFVVDGRTLADREKRNGTITSIGQLGGRLGTMLAAGHQSRLMIVLTHLDAGEIAANIRERIQQELLKYDLKAEIVAIASFSENQDQTPAGAGIAHLIDRTASVTPSSPPFWPVTAPKDGTRAFMSHRRTQ